MRFRGFALESPRGISTAGRWSKALLAAALALGTVGTALAVVGVAPASAAGTPTITSVVTTSGPLAGGSANKITITGTNFEAVADDTVDFGPGHPGTVHSQSGGTTLVVYPPAATQYGPVQLTVTTSVSGGTSNAVTYTYAPAPAVTALYSANGPTGGGTTIIVTGTNFVGPGAVSAVDFNTTAATSFTVNSSTNISVVVPNMPDTDTPGKTYYVTVVTDSGTSPEGPGSAWYWFGAGSCTMSGPGVQNSGAPPGASAYILNATEAVGGSTGTTVSGSTTFSDPNASFNSSEVGQSIEILNAGKPTQGTGYTTPDGLSTTIASVVSPTEVTLATAAGASITGSAQWDLTSLANNSDGTTTASSTTFTTTGADFSAADVGDTIYVAGAGASGGPLVTNIAAFVSSSQITLGTAATTAASNADWAIYNTTVIGTACTGLSGLGLTAPMIESLSDPEAAIVSGTGPNGGPGGNETFLGWSGQNGYSTDVNGSYDAGFVLPFSGPNTTGGCPLEPGPTGLCALAQGEGEDAFFGTDPQGTCPPSQAEANAGLVQCSLAALAADEEDNSYIATAVDVAYANDPTPANPTTTISPSSGLSAGQTVTVNACDTCNWWGAGQTGAPGYASPAGADGVATAIPAPTVFMGSTRASAVPVTNSTVAITPASYNCGTSGGSALSPPGPVATCILGTAPVTNSSGTVTSGSTTLTDPAGAFNSGIVGQAIAVQGAGASGAALVTTITGVTSASQLTLGTAASTSISGSAVYTYGVSKEGTTGTTTASSSAIACSTTGTVPASCKFTDTNAHFASSDLNKSITVYGAGPAASPLTTSIIAVSSATSVELGFEASTAISGTAGYTYGTLLQGSTGTATAASKTFTDTNASFVSGNVGDDIVITGAGPSGTSLVTTIAAVNSATSITLGTAASTSVSGSAPYAYGTPTQGTISGTFTVPTGLTCGTSCNVYIDEPDTTLTNGNYSGSGSYNVGLTYNLVNAVEGSTTASCTTGCGTVTTAPTVSAVSPDNGPAAGTNTVTVTGTGFDSGSTSVDFGTANPGTSVDVTSSTNLTVSAPSGTGTVDVTVTTPNGTSPVNAPSDQYTYNAAPTVSAVSPDNGPAAGTNTVTVTGTGFDSGSTSVDFGTANPGTSVDVTSSSSLSVVVPAGTGTVSVTVSTTAGGTSTPLADAYTYNAAPTVSAVSPDNGPAAGTNTVTVTGTGFDSGSTSVDFGTANPGTSVDVTSSTNLTVSAPSGTGTVDVTVTTPNGTSPVNAPSDQYTYNAAPTVSAVSPDNGPAAGTNTVTVTGTGFDSGSTSVDFGTNAGTSVDVTSSSSLSVVVPAGTGTVSVTVSTTAGGTSTPLADAYTYNAAPTVSAVSPDNGPAAGTNTVTVTGTGFDSGSTSVDFGTNAGTSVDVTSSSSLSVVVPAGTGTVSVTVSTTAGGTSTPLADAYTYNASTAPGGAVALYKSTALIGNYGDKVSGTGWAGETTVSLNECATTTYSAATCDAANRVSGVPVGTGRTAGIFKNAVIDLAVGTIDSNGDTCGVVGSTPCYVVVVGNTGDSTSSGALGFTLPSFTVKKTTDVLGNYVDSVKAVGFPIGDTVVAQECDASVSVPSTISTHCDSTQITGTAGASGKVTFSPTGVKLLVGSAYSDTSGGTCQLGGSCAIGVTDSDNSAIGASVAVGFASPPTATLKKTSGVLGNYVDAVKAAGFPIGDTVVAQECDPSVVIPTTVASNCDSATHITGTAGARGTVVFSPTGVKLLVGGAYSDSASGTCPAGGNCVVVVSDSANPSIGTDVAFTFATPTVTLKETSGVEANYVDKVTAEKFPVGDTVTAQECDGTVTSANMGTHCDSTTQITGTVSAAGNVAFSPTGVTVKVGAAYGTDGTDAAGGTCPAGGSCDIVVNDSSTGAFIAIPVGLAS